MIFNLTNKISMRLVNFILIAIIAVAMVFLMLKVTSYLKNFLLEQRFTSVMQASEVRCDEGITDLDSFVAFYNRMDLIYNVFAAVYSSDFELLTRRHPDIMVGKTVKFEPFEHSEVIEAIAAGYSDLVIVPFTVMFDNGGHETYPTPLHFQKVDYGDTYVIAMVATPFIEDSVTLPNYYYPILYSFFITVLSVAIILIVIKL